MKRYPAYKDSGIEWIGEVPKGWEVKRLKYLDKCVMGQSPESDKCNKDSIGTPFLQGNADFMAVNPVPSVWCEEANKLAEKDDVLLSVRAPVGAVNIADQVYGIGRGLCAIRARQSHKRYLYFRTLCFLEELNSIATGSIYTAVSVEQVSNVLLPHPSYDEQEAIATYLDRKTAQIDELIAKKERMIELLEEERTAIISQAVTKGLDLKAEMKDSGIEWVGKVPKHWEVKRLKFLFKIVNGATPKSSESDFWDGDISWATPDDFSNARADGTLAESRRQITSVGYQSCGTTLAPRGSIIVSTRAPIGYVAILGKDMCCNQGCRILVKHRMETNEQFFYYYLSVCSEVLNSLGEGSTFKELSRDKLAIFCLLNLPVKEQRQIVEFIDHKIAQIDTHVSRERKSVELLKEYRTDLISEVVTGKIDVRN